MLQDLVAQIHTEQDLLDARPGIGVVVDEIVSAPATGDEIILYSSWDVRNALSGDPSDPVYGDGWSDAMKVALQELYRACVEAGYIASP